MLDNEKINFINSIKEVNEELGNWVRNQFICGKTLFEVRRKLRRAIVEVEHEEG